MNPDVTCQSFTFDSDAYRAALVLRDEVLRQPLGLRLTEADTAHDISATHLGAFIEDVLVGCVSLRVTGQRVMKLRQMAVLDTYQRQGIGRTLMEYADIVARAEGMDMIETQARLSAAGFYEGLGYVKQGDVFEEVTIPHIAMTKAL